MKPPALRPRSSALRELADAIRRELPDATISKIECNQVLDCEMGTPCFVTVYKAAFTIGKHAYEFTGETPDQVIDELVRDAA